jgi:carbonic anhydrase
MATQCDAIVVTCIDFRFQKSIHDWLTGRVGYNNYDRVSLAGGVFDLPAVLRQVEVSDRLHQIKRVLLVNHEDCGAYGESGTPARHAADLRAAAQKLREEFPHLKVEAYYLHLSGIFEQVPLG